MHTAGGNQNLTPFTSARSKRHSSTSRISCGILFSDLFKARRDESNLWVKIAERGRTFWEKVIVKLKLSLFTNHEHRECGPRSPPHPPKSAKFAVAGQGGYFSITSSPCRKKQKFVLAQSKKVMTYLSRWSMRSGHSNQPQALFTDHDLIISHWTYYSQTRCPLSYRLGSLDYQVGLIA